MLQTLLTAAVNQIVGSATINSRLSVSLVDRIRKMVPHLRPGCTEGATVKLCPRAFDLTENVER